MAVITGYTATRMKEIEDTTVVSGSVNTLGNLILSTRVGAQIDAGAVMDPLQPGTVDQYYRGDKTWQALTKGAVLLGNVDNTSDVNKPVSTAQKALFTPRWKPSTVYAIGEQVLSPFNETVSSKTARTSAATWSSTEANNWAGQDNMMVFENQGFGWSGSYASWDAGPLSVSNHIEASSQKSIGKAFASPGAISGTLNFNEIGIYGLSWYVQPNGNPGTRQLSIKTTGTWPGTPGSWWDRMGALVIPDNPVMWESQVYGIVRVPEVNLNVRFIGQQGNATTNVTSIRIHKLASI